MPHKSNIAKAIDKSGRGKRKRKKSDKPKGKGY